MSHVVFLVDLQWHDGQRLPLTANLLNVMSKSVMTCNRAENTLFHRTREIHQTDGGRHKGTTGLSANVHYKYPCERQYHQMAPFHQNTDWWGVSTCSLEAPPLMRPQMICSTLSGSLMWTVVFSNWGICRERDTDRERERERGYYKLTFQLSSNRDYSAEDTGSARQ